MRSLLLLVVALLLGACEGPAGPVGPAGPAGPTGSLNRHVASAVVSSGGTASVALPVAAGSNSASPPGLTCYLSLTVTTGVWLNVTDGDSPSSAYCALSLSAGVWRAQMNNAPAGWVALFVATW